MAQTGQSALPCASYLESAPAKAPNSANVFRSQYAQVANYCAAQWKDFAPPLTLNDPDAETYLICFNGDSDAPAANVYVFSGYRRAYELNDAIQFLASAGTFTGGKIRLYGIAG